MSAPGHEPPAGGRVTDPARLAAVRRSGLLGSSSDFERVIRLARVAIGAPVVLFSVIDDEHQYFPAHMGLSEPWATSGWTPLSYTYCWLVVERDGEYVVTDSAADPVLANHPANEALGVAAYAGVPVHDPDGAVLGAFCVIDREPRNWSATDLTVLQDLAASIEGQLALRSAGDELGRRLARDQQELALQQGLAAVASAANRVDGIRAVADALVAHASGLIGASVVSVAVVDDDQVELHHGPGIGSRVAAAWQVVGRNVRAPLVTAAVEQRRIVLPDPASLVAWPEIADEVDELGLRAYACLPVADRSSGLQAAIGFGWQAPLDPPELPSSVGRLTTLTTQALARAMRFDQERAQARTLERLVIPGGLPETAGVSVAGSYLAPSTRQRVGGDLYDAVARDDGAIGIVIADAVGHDLDATRAAARVRHAVGMLTIERVPPAQVLQSVNSYLLQSSRNRLVTCAYLLLDPVAGAVTVANAGHPQPRLVRDGQAVPVGPMGEPLLGLGPQHYRQVRLELQRGDVLVGFTDGLIERRNASLQEGESWLEELLTVLGPQPVDAIGAALLAQVNGVDRDDDIALVVARYDGIDPGETGPALTMTLPADDIQLAVVRRQVRDWLQRHARADADPVISLVVTELLTNARAASMVGAPVHLEARLDRGEIIVAVENIGPMFEPDRAMPSPRSERGRGLALVRELSSRLTVEVSGSGVRVEARLDDPGTEGLLAVG